jgi:hypothetical protein
MGPPSPTSPRRGSTAAAAAAAPPLSLNLDRCVSSARATSPGPPTGRSCSICGSNNGSSSARGGSGSGASTGRVWGASSLAFRLPEDPSVPGEGLRPYARPGALGFREH